MKNIKYVIYRDGDYYVSQSLNVDVSSFGSTIDEATVNLKEALGLYFEDETAAQNYHRINEALLGDLSLNI